MKRVLVLGAAGQLAQYLIPQLCAAGAVVSALVQSDAQAQKQRDQEQEVFVGNVLDLGSIARALARAEPDTIIHLASPSFVPDSWAQPRAAFEALASGTLNVLDAARLVCPRARVLCAASAEIFARTTHSPQTSRTPPAPASPYGIGKAAAFEFVRLYRERYAQQASSLVLYPFESPWRAPNFVIPKICHAAARISRNRSERLKLGDTSAQRDWSWAEDVAAAFVAAARAPEVRDVLIGSGKMHRVSDALERAFQHVGLDWRNHVDIDESLVRPGEPVLLTPDVSETKAAIRWEAKTSFEEMIDCLVDAAGPTPVASSP